METADRCRRAASEAIEDVEPPELVEYIETVLEDASMVPGALALETAATFDPGMPSVLDPERADGRGPERARPAGRVATDGCDPTGADGIVTQAAGVQLIYEGLRLTRSLARAEPWTTDDGPDEHHDLEILAADILVARGFYLLARTEAADRAVRTVQAFGRDQTRRDEVADHEDPVEIDANLERDVLELAVLAGAAAVGETPTPRLDDLATAIAEAAGPPFPPAEECFRSLESSPGQLPDEPPKDRATSATDS